MGDNELLEMLAKETDRRRKPLIKGVEKLSSSGKSDPKKIESMRVDAHGIKGAAMVVGQQRISELAKLVEDALAARVESGQIEPDAAQKIVAAVTALNEGAQAAAKGEPEPPSVGASLAQFT